MSVRAIVLAGSRPGQDPLAAAHGTDLKALIQLAGKPMVRWPVEALLGSADVERVTVLAQQPQRLAAVLPADSRLTVACSAGSIAATLDELCEDDALDWPLLVTTADHALLNSAMIAEFCRQSSGADIAIGVVEQRALLARLPGSRRTWIRLRGGAYTGANLFGLSRRGARKAIELWRPVEQDRKKGWRLLRQLGPLALLGAAFRVSTLEQLLSRLGRRLGVEMRAVVLSDPLAGVDVDKPEDHALVESILVGQP